MERKSSDPNGKEDTSRDEYELSLIREKAKKSKYDRKRTRKEFDKAEDYILFFYKRILREWEKDLQARPDDLKSSGAGKNESKRQKQTRGDIRPFFKQLKARSIPGDLLYKVEKMVLAANENQNYMEAKRLFF